MVKKKIDSNSTDVIVFSSNPQVLPEAAEADESLAITRLKPPNLTDLAKLIKDALDKSGVKSWKTTLEVSLGVGPVGLKGTLELGNQ